HHSFTTLSKFHSILKPLMGWDRLTSQCAPERCMRMIVSLFIRDPVRTNDLTRRLRLLKCSKKRELLLRKGELENDQRNCRESGSACAIRGHQQTVGVELHRKETPLHEVAADAPHIAEIQQDAVRKTGFLRRSSPTEERSAPENDDEQ